MEIIRYRPAMQKQWDDFIRASRNGTFMFCRDYMDYHADRFHDHSLMVYEENKLLAVLPANQAEGVLHSHQGLTFGGFICGKRMRAPLMLQAFDTLQAYARVNGLSKIIYKAVPWFYHKQPAQEDIYALFRAGATCYRVDVSSTLENNPQRYPFSSSRKSGFAKAREHNLVIVESDDFEWFFKEMNTLLDDKYATKATHTAAEMKLLHSRFPNNIQMLVCQEKGEFLAGVIMYVSDIVAHTQYMVSTSKGKDAGAMDVLLDNLINQRYAAHRFFDFGISTEKGGTYLNEGLISQKEGTGARATVHQFYELNL